MHKEVQQLLERSPRPLPWTIAILALAFAAIYLQSAIFAALWGIIVGAYFGNYRGRMRVLDAWRLDVCKEYEKLKAS